LKYGAVPIFRFDDVRLTGGGKDLAGNERRRKSRRLEKGKKTQEW